MTFSHDILDFQSMRRFIPSFSALVAFEASARHMSFTKAADDIGITQSGVSRQVNQLEAYLGLHLFERSGSRLVLTQSGTSYYRDIALVLDKLEEVSIDAVRGRKTDRSLMVGGSPALVTRWLAPRLSSFVTDHGGTPVEILSLDQKVDFETSKVDVAILRGSGLWSNARAIKLFDEELVVVSAPSLVPTGCARLAHLDFSEIPTLQNASRPSLWLNWLRMTGIPHSGMIQGVRFANSEILISAALSGLGMAVVPYHYVQHELSAGLLHLPFGPSIRSRESYWIVHSERKSRLPNIIAFRDWLLREAARDRKGPRRDTT